MELKDGLSVIICCYNSAWIIGRCLEVMIQQKAPKNFCWEIIVVNNNCSDNTAEIVSRIAQKSDVKIKMINESNPGLLNARKAGIETAQYRYSIYCDDDNLLNSNYVYGMYQLMSSDNQIGCAGGMGEPEFMTNPDPFILKHLPAYAIGSQKKHESLFGAGLCVKTSLVKTIYQTQTFRLTGRSGNRLLAGDDGELVLSILIRGYKRAYSDELKFIHVLAPHRLTKDYYFKMSEGFWLSTPIIYALTNVLHSRSRYYSLRSYLGKYFLLFKFIIEFIITKDSFKMKNTISQIKAYHFWGFRAIWSVYDELEMVKK